MNWREFAGKSLYLDANLFIYALEGVEPFAAPLKAPFIEMEAGSIHAVTSELTLAEVLARPFKLGAMDHVDEYKRIFAGGIAVTQVPVSRSLLVEAARLRGSNGLKLADAIHLATAISTKCSVIVSNDAGLTDRCGPAITGLHLSNVL